MSRFRRRQPGIGWLIAFLVVPVLLATIGWGGSVGSEKSDLLTLPSVDPSATLTATAEAPPEATPAPDPAGAYPPMSIVRNGTGYTLTGQLPDEQTKKGLIDTLNLVLPGATIVDELTVVPGVKMPDVAGLGGLFSAAVAIPDFALRFENDIVTLTGKAPAEPVKASAGDYARMAWPNVEVVNEITVG